MVQRMLTAKEIDDLETRIAGVLGTLKSSEGEIDVEAEFHSAIAADSAGTREMYDEIRQMSRRFGPRLIAMLGFPAVPGACSLRVARDGTRADLDIAPPTADARAVSEEEVRAQLAKLGVVFGIDEVALRDAVSRGRTEEVKNAFVAAGLPPVDGHDGRIEPVRDGNVVAENMNPPDSSPERLLPIAEIETVDKGQKIAQLLPPDKGTAGKDVYGKEIPAEAGRAIVPKIGPNVSFDAYTGSFFARESGRMILEDRAIDVEKLLEIKGDIDMSVGHVQFPGELLVRGFVRAGFSVRGREDVVIGGGVEAATVISQDGSILIGRGIQGSGIGLIQAGADIHAKFIEHATVMAGGILRTESAIGSTLAAGEAVTVTEGRGVVIGGTIFAGERVEVRDLGAGAGEATAVHLGITPDQLRELTRHKQRLQAILSALEESELALAHFGLSAESLQGDAVTEEGRKMLKLARTILVLKNRQRKIQMEETQFIQSMKSRTDGIVDVRGRVFPGVRIQIGHSTHLVTEPLSWVRFKYDPDRRRIRAIPLF